MKKNPDFSAFSNDIFDEIIKYVCAARALAKEINSFFIFFLSFYIQRSSQAFLINSGTTRHVVTTRTATRPQTGALRKMLHTESVADF